jgi:hypothetical protein
MSELPGKSLARGVAMGVREMKMSSIHGQTTVLLRLHLDCFEQLRGLIVPRSDGGKGR